MSKEGKLFVISGPSGVGKDTLVGEVLESLSGCERVVTATTRPPRQGEQDGRDYLFLTQDMFNEMKNGNAFLESAKVHGYEYGTPAESVLGKLGKRKSLILAIDVQGARQIKNKMREAVLIFITPPSLEELKRRLERRSTEDHETRRLRVEAASTEMEQIDQYDYAIVNRDIKKAAKELKIIIESQLKLSA